jgi:DNA-binding CsgD family transcriptional regulator/ligand-binding sensor domain-containing protein
MIFSKYSLLGCLLFSLVLLISNTEGFANSMLGIKNYAKQEYRGANQNWSVAQDSKGYMYFANNIGLLEFDGITWSLYPSPEGAILRSVAVDKHDRIFTAGYRELGYWERNVDGHLEYHSLKKMVESNFTANEEFWNVIATNGRIYFQSFSKIYIYDFQKFDVIRPGGFINSVSDGGDRIFVNIMKDGIYEVSGNSIKPFLVSNIFNQSEIRFVLPVGPKKILIGTSNDGLKCWDGLRLVEWNPAQTEYFRKNIINRGCLTSDGKIIIGTILDGISVLDQDGRLLYRINKENGLQNNTVLGLISDKNLNIWIALDKGIDFISLSPDPSYSVFEQDEIGAVYTAAIYHDRLYLGTNQGLYSKEYSSKEDVFSLVPSTQGQVWDCKVIDDRLFVNHNKGTFEIHGDQVRLISTASGGFSITENPIKPNSLVQSTYSNLIFYKKQNDEWKIDRIIYKFNELARYLEIDHLGNFWAGHMYRGIFRLNFDNNDSLATQEYYGQNVFGKDHGIHVFKIENRIVFTSGDKLFTFDDLKDTIVDYASINSKLGEFKKATRIISAPDHHYWFITGSSCGLFRIQNSRFSKIKEFPTSLFNNQLIAGYENIVPITDKKAILCLENGYAILNADTVNPTSKISEEKPDLRQITVSGNNGQQYNLPISGQAIRIHFNRNNIQLSYSFPFYSRNAIKYLSYIEGLDQRWSDPIDQPVFNFKRIPVGSFKIRVKAVNSWGEFSGENSLALTILPPWYRSMVAIFCYFLLFIGGLFAFRRSIIYRTRLKERHNREEKERELIQLRNEKLQAELSFKSSELASSTMAIIKKNEFLMDVKEMLKEQKEQLGTRYPDKYYDKLVRKIDDNMSSHDEWKVFEANFERAHEQFMKTLNDRFEDLTPSDLRLCAFLRMNLSSKEIAPLLGISVRGVENHRYRLRKKFNLEADHNLTDYIIRL